MFAKSLLTHPIIAKYRNSVNTETENFNKAYCIFSAKNDGICTFLTEDCLR